MSNLRVWHVPQVPCEGKPFYVSVDDVEMAAKIIKTLAHYDLYQLENNIKPDYANASGLEVFDAGEWIEWDDEYGNGIDDYMQKNNLWECEA